MGGNTFYSNAEAYAYEILHQKMIKEAHRSAQETLIELAALRSFLSQGQLLYCIPFGGFPHHNPLFPTFPFPPMPTLPSNSLFPPPDPHSHPLPPPDPHSHPLPPPPPPPPTNPPSPTPLSTNPSIPQSSLHVNVKNASPKISPKSGSDECNLGKDGVEVSIDLREYLPAEITIDVEEKTIEIKARHVDPQGSKTFARRYDLPACIILDSVRCILSHDGVLHFSAAWIKME